MQVSRSFRVALQVATRILVTCKGNVLLRKGPLNHDKKEESQTTVMDRWVQSPEKQSHFRTPIAMPPIKNYVLERLSCTLLGRCDALRPSVSDGTPIVVDDTAISVIKR
jgi:hypothetical protein